MSTENISFIPTTAADHTIISKIYNYYVLQSTATYHIGTLTVEETAGYFGLGEAQTKAYLIRYGGDTAGFGLIRPYSKKQGYAYTSEITIYLHKDYTGKEIGSRAVSFLEEVARQNGTHVLLAGICTENTASMRLFRKAGYSECGLFKEVGYKFERFLDTAYFQKIIG
jgi:L-amino acid N-acyltransferase YncA